MSVTFPGRKSLGNKSKRSQGFTLLEVLIALAIMVLILGSILSVQSSSLNATATAKEMNVVAMLARNLMSETETKLQGKGFGEVSDQTEGPFAAPYQDYHWKVEIKEVEFPKISFNPAQSGSGEDSGGAADNGTTDLVDTVLKVITNYFTKAIREVQVTIIWKRGNQDVTYTVSTFWVNLNTEFSLGV